MKKKNKIILELKAEHFKDTKYWCNKCAIGKAFNEEFGYYPSVGKSFIETKEARLEFSSYDDFEFVADKKKAKKHNWDDTVIRTIELIEP